MIALTNRITEQVAATSARFVDDILFVTLSDGREISLPMEQVEWLAWLTKASPQQRSKWSIEPCGFAIHWEELDDGIEVRHLLELHSLA